jgi:hypothetical protein
MSDPAERTIQEKPVRITTGAVKLDGNLSVPEGAWGGPVCPWKRQQPALGSEYLAALMEGQPAEAAREQVTEVVCRALHPEFLNRRDEIVLFNRLGRNEMKRIVDIRLKYLQALLAGRKINIPPVRATAKCCGSAARAARGSAAGRPATR